MAMAVLSSFTSAAGDATAGLDFFERKVRPALVQHCYGCHSPEAPKGIKGGLRLDTRDGLRQGGDSGPAIQPGKPESSLLIKAIRYTDENLLMPPNTKQLPQEVVADLEHWVRIGAPDPRVAAGVRTSQAAAELSGEFHWAFRPLSAPAMPQVRNERWIESPVDAFVLAKLEMASLSPAPRASRRTLIRRLYADLIGMPPTPEEVERFNENPSPQAYAGLVDELLASPHYGERWGRHWLDVARYADSKGYVFEEERRYPYAYTYRDYVIRAINEDLPFDRFIIEQLAADLLPLGEDKRPLAALGFLTLGRRFLNNQHDIIDDRIDVMSRGLMGLTVVCARCHDHKYDPIPSKDYYSLYSVFASSHEPSEKPLLGANSIPPQYETYVVERERRVQERDDFRQSKNTEIRSMLRKQAGEYLLAAQAAAHSPGESERDALARQRKLDPGVLRRWLAALEGWERTHHSVFTPWISLAKLGTNNAARLQEAIAAFRGRATTNRLNPLVLAALQQPPVESTEDAARRYQKLFDAALELAGKFTGKSGADPSPPPPADPDQAELHAVLFAADYPPAIADDQLPSIYDVPSAQKSRALQRKVEELDATHPGSPPRAMALLDNRSPHSGRVFVRGNPNNSGPEVPRQFLGLLSGPVRTPFTNGSGRLELARAIANPANPLTARVLVNRVWMHHFGAPLVRTPSDFGVRADPPTHPELLDYLAHRFMAEGWSLKKLHRWMLLSSTFQQSSDGNAESHAHDPSNVMLGRMNRRRLDLEAMRDSFLALSGRIDFRAGGQPVEIASATPANRRTIYGFVERQNLPGMFRTFDFASPDTTSAQRFATSVPQQALYLMNSPFIIQQTRGFLSRTDSQLTIRDRIRTLYKLAYQREPVPEEIEAAAFFIGSQTLDKVEFGPPPPQPPFEAWERFAQTVLLSNEVSFVD